MRVAVLLVIAGCWSTSGPAMPPSQAPAVAKPVIPALPRQEAATLITVDEVRRVTGFTDELEAGSSPAPMTDTYDDVHFKAIGKTERFDFMLRVWTVGPAAAATKFDELISDLPAVRPLPKLAERAITATEDEIYGVAFFDKRGAVVLVTCGMGQCASIDQVIELARGAAARIH